MYRGLPDRLRPRNLMRVPGISPRKRARLGAQNPGYQGRGSETASCNSHGPTSSSTQEHGDSLLAQGYQRLDNQKESLKGVELVEETIA